MKKINFNELLLKTAFSCMACDGDIDNREIKLIKQLLKHNKTFGHINVNAELDNLLIAINENGPKFMRDYFNELETSELTEASELNLIEVALDTIKADEKVEYAEIKFFKVIRSKLKIKNETILEKHPDFEEYLEQDIITDSYLSRLQNDYINSHMSNEFKLIDKFDEDLLDNLINIEEK